MPTAQPLRTGDPQQLGEYTLSGRLGEGGQGAVFLGTRGGERYAVKLLHGPVGDERAAFLREVELAKHVARFCTAQVIDAGFDEGRPYIVSEYVDGPSLQREVALTGPRRGGALERLAVGTATALLAIHQAGIVHRDFKPQNVLLGPDGPRVIDFGLAKALDAAATVSGRGVGTPAYMAPEQITASAVTGAADVFSWGATMCFAANATAPFGQDSVAPVLHRILTAPPELGLLDGRLRTLVESCLDKDARNRPTSRELLFALLGDADGVLSSPPAPVLRTVSPLVPEPRTPMAEPEATGASGGYVLPGSPDSAPGEASGDVRGGSGAQGPRTSGSAGWARVGRPPEASRSGPGTSTGQTPRRGWPRAAVAVCAALTVSAAVLLTVLIPTFDQQRGAQAGPRLPGTQPPVLTQSPIGESTPIRTRSSQKQSAPPSTPVSKPPPVTRPATVPVPSLVGMSKGAATKALKKAGLALGAVTETDSPEKIGRVLSTEPASGAEAATGSEVALEVSKGMAVPSVTGKRREVAETALTDAGLAVGTIGHTCSEQPSGQVVGSDPGAGSRVAGGTAVNLTLSRRGTAVPPVVGRAKADGRAALRDAGFQVRERGQMVEDEARVGTILRQSMKAGSCARPGAAVLIVVGVAGQTGPPDPGEEPSPTPSGQVPGE
ncbi:PASTA domain-containing protein [Nonomuraea sp. KC401]|uniref:protein kinase domain-containing protein n=1 Tax=unclassified Nonomuraea TaxID=2593643 RepID=UPI0010FD286C|nr:PASTA domain-containing protein [Nonomuraea sp. KC401]NBE97412.1 PASTA domain-containing protein [Nonomuraea sp. K271]TLF64864.1 PASTA domain-containing protein [Nonomuraea sp. KC401]